jgi:hypothetical protein
MVGPCLESSQSLEAVSMSTNYAMMIEEGEQRGTEESFVGGRPALPVGTDVPCCVICDSAQTFFFQVAFPSDHAWTGWSVASFACTSCASEDSLIPEMIPGSLPGADVPTSFLTTYQRNFRFEVFETRSGRMLHDCVERVRFRRVQLRPGNRSGLGLLGGEPEWVLADEAPGSFDSASPPTFLLQVSSGFQFATVPGSPRQVELGLDGTPEPSPYGHYQLFIGNMTYLFGAKQPTAGAGVYVLTQT